MSIENPFSQSPQESGEQEKSNIVEARTPEGEMIKIDIDGTIRKQQKTLKELGFDVDLSKFEITDKMRENIKDGIERGFTELLFVPGADNAGTDVIKSAIGKILDEKSLEKLEFKNPEWKKK